MKSERKSKATPTEERREEGKVGGVRNVTLTPLVKAYKHDIVPKTGQEVTEA